MDELAITDAHVHVKRVCGRFNNANYLNGRVRIQFRKFVFVGIFFLIEFLILFLQLRFLWITLYHRYVDVCAKLK